MTTMPLEKYDKKQLAVLDVEKLTRAVDRSVKDRFVALNEAMSCLEKAVAKSRSYAGGNIETENKLHQAVAQARKTVSDRVAGINNYMEEQRAMFSARNVSPDMAYTWAIVPVGETLPSGAERCRMVKRRFTLEPSDDSDDADRSVNATLRMPSNLVSRDMRRGKFHDGTRLILESVCGIDHSEIDGVCD